MNTGFEKINVHFDGGDKPFESGKVIIEPLERGYGLTLGNTLRRILLSSIPGASVIGLKIPGLNHEFDMIPGAVTDVTELMMNLKKMRFSCEKEGLHTIRFLAEKEGEYFARDLQLPTGVELQTPDVKLLSLAGDREVEIEMYIRNGKGYVPAEKIQDFDNRPDIIVTDGLFSPVKNNVMHEVENVRIGSDPNYERLILSLTTDGSVHPKDAVMLASKIAHSHFAFFENMSDMAEKTEIFQEKQEEEEANRVLDLPVEHLDLSARSFNCLKRENLKYVRDIVNLTRGQVAAIHQLGTKSVDEIIEKIEELGLDLKKE